MIVSHDIFIDFITFAVGSLAIVWVVRDAVLLVRLLQRGKSNADERFGYIVGIAMACVALYGLFKFHFAG